MAEKKSSKPDPILVKDQLQQLQAMYGNYGPEVFTQNFIWLLAKEPSPITNSRTIPFRYNRIQKDVEKHFGKRNICLKPRQVGLTTFFTLRRLYVPTIVNPGTNALLISQNGEYATKHFRMLRRADKTVGMLDPRDKEKNKINQSLLANLLHKAYSNKKELIFDQLDCTISIESAENEEAGQGVTLARVLASEVARWPGNPEETLANLKEAIILDGTLDMESTANGFGGYFQEECFRAEKGQSEFVFHFHPWWWDEGYRIPLNSPEALELENDLTSDERKLADAFNLDLEQIAFRRNKQKSLRHNFDEKYPETPESAFLTSGSTYFDKDILRTRLIELLNFKPYESMAEGRLVYLKPAVPGVRYILGADVASGKIVAEDSDYSAIKVVEEMTGQECAVYMNREAPEDFAQTIFDLGHYYNDALAAVERSTAQESGGEGGTVLLILSNMDYPNIYRHQEFFRDANTGERRTHGVPGFPTNSSTRPIILNKLRYKLANFPELFTDKILLNQMLTFVRDERGRPAASEGKHDDDVMASAIAEGARAIRLGSWDPLIRMRERYAENPSEYKQPEEIPS